MTTAIALLARYWYAVAIGVLLVALGVQTVRLADEKAEHAEAVSLWAKDQAARQQTAREHRDKIGALERQHAAEQQQLEETHAERIKALEDRRRADSTLIAGLRNTVSQYAAADSLRGGDVDAAAIQRAADRLEALAALVGEGVELLAEGRSLVELRDEEVGRLLGQIKIDRLACERQNAPAQP